MNEPKTPNLGLNKIDRSSPSTTYFDLDKYLDQNWEKVDEGVGQVEEKAEETAAQVSSIQERLDTEKRRSVTLEPGVQIINAERASAFKLEGLKGVTLVNLLGRDGGCEDLSKIGVHQSTLTLDSTNKVQGSNGLKIAISTGTSGIGFFTVSLKAGKSYVAIAEVKNFDGTSMFINLPGVGAVGNPVKDKSKFNVTWTRYMAPTDIKLNIDVGVSGTAVGQYGYADAVRLYEVSTTDYAALASMSPEQVGAKYPYVDSIQPVRNPYAIRYGENLLPPFYEWNQIGTDAKIASPYHLSVNTANAGGSYTIVKVPCLPNTTYRVKADVLTGPPVVIAVESLDETENTISTKYFMDGSFITEANARSVRISIYRVDAGALEVKNPTLTIGAESKPFKPREDAMLALQTNLYADPLTGTNADEVFEKDGQYFKLEKWKKLVLDGSLPWVFNANYSGYKRVAISFTDPNIVTSSDRSVKYDGKILEFGNTQAAGDRTHIYKPSNILYVSVFNADSGWGDAYTPTADEIKAYFMGWRMFLGNQGDVSKPYNGEAAGKAWCPLDSIYAAGTAATTYVLTVPINPITTLTYTRYTLWTPYQLVYQLATPTVEPITSEGQLTLIEGNNQVEVGTGIVLREGVKPYANSTLDYAGINAPSSPNYPGTGLQTKVSKLLKIYKNGRADNEWNVQSGRSSTGGGEEYADIKLSQYDASATYTVTYLMLDTFPIASFFGSIAENEKALLTDMNAVVRQNAAAVSVVEMAVNEAVRQLLQQQNKRNVWGEIF
ncbi:hypothetical protein BS614_10165 [Paenibacillus xylanexedens]|uniref:hypothetical protein n=1 Tax=Paenibacillus xylanexedens TaxID=528191 RepID=UPI00093876BB|nr:hypothetical protein [Paenibacillus xylanexedens]APO44333.1 hypothetical protein BS614_10165 [Paenibacillus xylanexedens]